MECDGLDRCGVVRKSQNTNVLLVHPQLGKSKRVTYELPSHKSNSFAYGLVKPRDTEGARDVSMKWVSHQPNPDNKPGPDFIAMNKNAADKGIIRSCDQGAFRADAPVTLKTGKDKEGKHKSSISLPSDGNLDHSYGRSSSMRPYEETKLTGEATDIQSIVQGNFMSDWVRMNEKRAGDFTAANAKIVPRGTKATAGHCERAQKQIAAQNKEPKEAFKLSKFKSVPSRLMEGTTAMQEA